MDGQPIPEESTAAPPLESVYAHGCALFRKFVVFLLLVCLLLVGLWWVGREQAGFFIHHYLVQLLEEHYEPQGVVPRLGSVDYIEGQGIWLRDLSFYEAHANTAPILEIDEILIRSDARLIDILQQGFQAERVFIHRLHARIAKDAQGQYALSKLLPLPKLGNRRLPITVTDASAHLVLPLDTFELSEHLSNVHLEITPKPIEIPETESPGWVYQLQGEVRGSQLGRLKFAALFRDLDQAWSVAGKAVGLRLTTELAHASSQLAGQDFSEITRVELPLNADFTVTGVGFTSPPTDYEVEGEVVDARFDDERLPYSVTDITGTFSLTPDLWKLDEITARSGQGTLLVRGSRHLTGAHLPDINEVSLEVQNVVLDRHLALYMPPEVKKLWTEFDPDGLVNAKITLRGLGNKWTPDVHLDLLDVGMRFHLFRYPVRHCNGSLDWTPEQVSFDLKARASGSRLKIAGTFNRPGPEFTGRCDVNLLDPIPISEDLYEAFADKPDLFKLIRSFEPTGRIGVSAVFQRDTSTEPVHRSIVIESIDAAIRYEHFPYPITGINGKIAVEDEWVFLRDLQGKNDAGHVTCNGSFSPEKILALDFVATSVPLEEELRKALPFDLGSVWSQLRPQGDLDQLLLQLTHDFNRKKMKLRCEGQMWNRNEYDRNAVSVSPTWLPYTWDRVTGSFVYENGRLSLKDIRGQHRQTEITFQGQGEAKSDGWWLDLKPFAVDRLSSTNELLNALPEPMAESLRTTDFQGSINLLGRVILTHGLVDPGVQRPLERSNPLPAGVVPGLQAQWELDCDVHRASLEIATEELHDINGTVTIMGVMENDKVYNWGNLNLDTVMIWDSQATRVSGPFYLDNQRLALGTVAPQLDPQAPQKSVTANWLAGRLVLDGDIKLLENLPFGLVASLNNARLEDFADELAPQLDSLSGQARIGIQLTGTADGTHTLSGLGSIRMENAQIYEIPMMLSMLKLLSVQQMDRTAFNTSNIQFEIKGDRILLRNIDFIGDAISLKGVGEIDLNRRVQAQFHSTVGSSEKRIPVISDLFGVASRQILVINVEGTLDEPTVTQVPFPLINEALQNLLAQPEPTEPEIISGIPTVGEMFDEALGPAFR